MTRRKSRRWEEINLKRRNILLKEICDELFYAASSSANGKVPWGTVTRIVKQTVEDNPSINHNGIIFAYKKFLDEKKKEESKLVLHLQLHALLLLWGDPRVKPTC